MVQFLPLDVTDEDSVGVVLSHLDNAIQYGEHEEPKEPADVRSKSFAVGGPRSDAKGPALPSRRAPRCSSKSSVDDCTLLQMDQGDFDTEG